MKSVRNTIEYPYNMMLSDLVSIRGYAGFEKFIISRAKLNNDWKAEVKAIFELSKGPKVKLEITSTEKSGPEALFKLNGADGLIEASFIEFSKIRRSYSVKKQINLLENGFAGLKHLLERFNCELIIFVLDENISLDPKEIESAKCYFSKVINGMNNQKVLVRVINNAYVALSAQSNDSHFDEAVVEEYSYCLAFSRGISIIYKNSELTDKVRRTLQEKHDQHKEKPQKLKIYYFLVNCPAEEILKLNERRIMGTLRQSDNANELVVISAIGATIGGELYETKRVIAPSFRFFKDLCFDNLYIPHLKYLGQIVKESINDQGMFNRFEVLHEHNLQEYTKLDIQIDERELMRFGKDLQKSTRFTDKMMAVFYHPIDPNFSYILIVFKNNIFVVYSSDDCACQNVEKYAASKGITFSLPRSKKILNNPIFFKTY